MVILSNLDIKEHDESWYDDFRNIHINDTGTSDKDAVTIAVSSTNQTGTYRPGTGFCY
jgi:hypothetical protein